tara:strand:+ start:27 stop:218 length:192 start_codon:yes stop_codon:yes gene_type:complete
LFCPTNTFSGAALSLPLHNTIKANIIHLRIDNDSSFVLLKLRPFYLTAWINFKFFPKAETKEL